ncbi:molecular chaperone [Buttiauxella sp. B2]|uniref:fimbria/pilus periplasmic chaperone n=1 Tax=Buttiauxella sp. B2 TaxID=2587812 RepID=UPI00112036ED|nr:fimbria/pilus periplasmic chaperone [Buttiauxella sp. B2]TNV22520.1 molecular chaperone [Buttiauxella sp. B2]
METRHTLIHTTRLVGLVLTTLMAAHSSHAALALDRTRVVLNSTDKSVSLGITNGNKELPYLAQAWIEDADGNKVSDPLVALPPVQRIEPGAKSQVKVQVTAGAHLLAQDKETLYYFNQREIPPKSDKPNTLQIALQTRIKLFYRPAALVVDPSHKPWQEQLTLSRQGDHYVANNPTPYYVTVSVASSTAKGSPVAGFSPMMVPPKGNAILGGSASALGSSPVLTYINDYGGRPQLVFGCSGNTCSVKSTIQG